MTYTSDKNFIDLQNIMFVLKTSFYYNKYCLISVDAEAHSSPPYRLESDSLSHVIKHGIKLKSSSNLLRNDSRRVISGSRGSADGTANKPHYIENIVIPVSIVISETLR